MGALGHVSLGDLGNRRREGRMRISSIFLPTLRSLSSTSLTSVIFCQVSFYDENSDSEIVFSISKEKSTFIELLIVYKTYDPE